MLQRLTKINHWIFPISSLRTGRTRNVPDSSNHSLYLIKMLSSNPEGKRWILPFFVQSLNAPLLPVAMYSSFEARKNTLQTICSATFAPFLSCSLFFFLFFYDDAMRRTTTQGQRPPRQRYVDNTTPHPTTQPPNDARHTT